MKRFYKALAVVLAATTLMCYCAFAVDISYGCECTSTSSSADSSCNVPAYISASFGGTITYGNGATEDISGSRSYNSATSASCSRYYNTAATGSISSSHTIYGHGYVDWAGF